jgi:hypothetical protein
LRDVLVAETVEFVGGDTGAYVLADHVEHLGGQAAGLAHLLLFLGALESDGHGGGGVWLREAGVTPLGRSAVKRCFYGTCMV